MCLIATNPKIQQLGADIIAYKVCIFEDNCYKLISNDETIEFGKLYTNKDSLVYLNNIDGTLTVFSGLFHFFRYKADAELACNIISESIERKCKVIEATIPTNTEVIIGFTFWGTDSVNPKNSIATKQTIFNKI